MSEIKEGKEIKFVESETFEFKTSTGELKEAVIAIVAILNKHQKGELYFGINKEGRVIGQEVTDKTLRDVSQAISEGIEPKIFPMVENVSIEDRQCICVKFEGHEMPYFAYEKSYLRVGTENRQISAKELENLVISKNKEKMRWDNQICEEATLKDIDGVALKSFIEMTRESGRLKILDENSEQILKKLNLIRNGQITNAAIVLFGKEPKKFFSNSIIKCGRFKDELKEEFFDIRDLEGNIFKNIEDSIGFLKDHLRLTAKIEGLYRKEKWEMPIESLRESIINALIHRDYVSSSFTYIKIYDSKILISNPGKLPVELTIEDLYKEHESIPKNPLLAETLYYTGLIDVWGRGIQNIIGMLKEEGLPKPKFEESAGSFRIVFDRPKIVKMEENGGLSGGLSGGLNLVYDLIKRKTGIMAKDISDELKIPKRTIDRNISKLIKLSKIERRGSRKTGGYFIKEERINKNKEDTISKKEDI